MTKKLTAIGMCLIMLLSITGCSSKKAITGETFMQTMEEKGYEVEQYDDSANNAVIYGAANDDCYITFAVYDTKEDALQSYTETKEMMEAEEGSTNTSSSVSSGSHSHYSLTTTEFFGYTACTDNTMLLLAGDKEVKSELQDLVDELGY